MDISHDYKDITDKYRVTFICNGSRMVEKVYAVDEFTARSVIINKYPSPQYNTAIEEVTDI